MVGITLLHFCWLPWWMSRLVYIKRNYIIFCNYILTEWDRKIWNKVLLPSRNIEGTSRVVCHSLESEIISLTFCWVIPLKTTDRRHGCSPAHSQMHFISGWFSICFINIGAHNILNHASDTINALAVCMVFLQQIWIIISKIRRKEMFMG